ncbi:MAG: ribosome maturation factor RimM [Oscillospiraceae bacterium]|nr:ribosome maturation factor RimM [Oscillospiraceae bacterium]
MRDTLVVGHITTTHGIKGEVKVHPYTSNINRFSELNYVIIDGKNFNIENVKYQKDKVILKLENINSIEEACLYKNKELEVNREDGVKLDEGEYYIADIIGCKVYDENGEFIGEVFDYIETRGNDVYSVNYKGEELLIPVVEHIVPIIDVDNQKIIIKPLNTWL